MKANLRERATELRDSGYSYNMISEELGISKSTLSDWFRSRPFKPNAEVMQRIKVAPFKSAERSHNIKVAEINSLKEIGISEIGQLSQRDLWLLGLGLYIGEGAKSQETIQISNADPMVIRLAIHWLKETFELTDENITIRIHIYPDNDMEECLKFWREATGLSARNFRKTQIDRRSGKLNTKQRKLPFGTAHIRIVSCKDKAKGVRLHRRLMGWIAGALNNNAGVV